MGNTVLAHVLYSCNQVDLDIDNFFSSSGNSHNIRKLNQTDLIAFHDAEHNYPTEKNVILNIECVGWAEILRKKFSYEKWYECYPDENNYAQVGFTEPLAGQTYLENLVIKYFDSYTVDNLDSLATSTISLNDYLGGNFSTLKTVITENFNWTWNNSKSQVFYKKVLEVNQAHLLWLDKIKYIVQQCINLKSMDVDLLLWEKAIVISKVCYDLEVNPNNLHWNDYGCFLEKNNVTFIHSLERLNHGKTI
jgi:hypothetical protein